MGEPKPAARRPAVARGSARKDGNKPASTTLKPKQQSSAQARRSGKPANLKLDVDNLEPASPHAGSTSPIEKHMVNPPPAPAAAKVLRTRKSGSSFLQPDQFIAELRVKTGAPGNTRSELVSSPGSARSVRSTGSLTTNARKELRNGAAVAREPPPSGLRARKSTKPILSNRTQPGSSTTRIASSRSSQRESMSRGAGSSVQRSSRAETSTLYEPANSVPTLELSYEGKPAPAPAHLRVRTGPVSIDSTPLQGPSLSEKNGEAKAPTPELQKSASQGSGRFGIGSSPGLLKLQETSARLGRSCSPARMREKLVRSVSGKKDSDAGPREGDSRAVHSFHAGTGAKPLSNPFHSQPMKPTHTKSVSGVEDARDAGPKPAGRLRRMVKWGASMTGLEILKSLERKLGKKISKVSSGSKTGTGRAEDSAAKSIIDTEREIREVSTEKMVEDAVVTTFDDDDARSSVSSVGTTYSDVSSKSHSYKHSHHKKYAKSDAVKSRLWLLKVHHKLQGRKSEEDSIYDAVRGGGGNGVHHGTADAAASETLKDDVDVKKTTLPGSARFSSEKSAIAKLVAKHKRNSTWDAGKLSPNDHLFSPKQPRLPKSDAHLLLAPPKKLTNFTTDTEFQQRRGNSTNLNVTDKYSSSPRAVTVAPSEHHQIGNVASRSTSRTTTPTRSRQGQITPRALPSPGAFLSAAALILASPDRGESDSSRSPKQDLAEVITPVISPRVLPVTSPRGSVKGFNSPLPLPVRVGRTSGSDQLSPPSPIYPVAQSPGRFASPARDGTLLRSNPTSPGLYALPPSWGPGGMPESPGARHRRVSSISPGARADGAAFQSSLFHGLDASASRASSAGSNVEEIFHLANSSFDSTSSSNSSIVLTSSSSAKILATKTRSGRNGVNGLEVDEFGSSVSDEREFSSDEHKLPASPRPPAIPFEQIVAGRGRSPPTDNTLMKFFFKCREIEHLNKFLALQKKRFLESFHTDSKKCFHMILSEAGQGLSSMISTLCTAWLLENTMASAWVKWHPIPVMNMSQEEMWQHRDAAWLFHVCGVEANAVLFLDEITSSNEKVVARRVKRAVAGQDILVTKGEVVSSCTIVSEKFRQEAPKLLQARYMKTLLLAGILVDTKNLSTGSVRDKQQATILLVGAGSLGRNGFYKHLVNIRDENYVTTFIEEIYGDSNVLTGGENPVQRDRGVERPKSLSASSQSHVERAERSPPSRPAPLRPPPLEIPDPPCEVPASMSPTPPAPLPKPTTQSSRKSDSAQAKLQSRKSEVPESSSRRSSRKSKSEVENGHDDSGKVQSSNKDSSSTSQNSKLSFGLRRFRNRSSA